jgi:hypothetical protein
MKATYLFVSLLATTAFSALSISAADATVLLDFGQTTTGDTVTGTRTVSTTTIASDTGLEIDAIAASVVTPILAEFHLDATSTGVASVIAGNVVQTYSGSFSFMNTAGTINYLSGTFSDAVFGSGGSLTLSASNETPGESVNFTSSVISPLLIDGLDRSIAFSFTNVAPPVSIVLGSLRSFASDVSGDFSATPIPETSTWAMMLLGFAGLGFVGYRSARRRASVVA